LSQPANQAPGHRRLVAVHKDSVAPVVGFDLDMTLVDSARGIAATLRAVLAELGRGVTDEQAWPYVGVPMQQTVRALAPDLDPEVVTRRYRQLYPEHGIQPITILAGAAEAFEAIHAVGGRVLVVSAKIEPAVRSVLAHVGLDVPPRNADVVAGDLFAERKGGALRAHGAEVYVGDHPGDVAAARAAGAFALGVATGPFTAEQLIASGSDVVLQDLRAFPEWLDRFVAGAVTLPT
jgi:phosphoglycolate phosphatase